MLLFYYAIRLLSDRQGGHNPPMYQYLYMSVYQGTHCLIILKYNYFYSYCQKGSARPHWSLNHSQQSLVSVTHTTLCTPSMRYDRVSRVHATALYMRDTMPHQEEVHRSYSCRCFTTFFYQYVIVKGDTVYPYIFIILIVIHDHIAPWQSMQFAHVPITHAALYMVSGTTAYVYISYILRKMWDTSRI